ncbi:MAG: hypothetical protein F6K35_19675 [Okeania sp. SIO2H7]|nr:hypothetical protein [Okeania sp. SIO2H7]
MEKDSQYDSGGNLIEEIVYSYDGDGNRQTVSSGVAEGTYSYENAHQLREVETVEGTESYGYDGGGRLETVTRDGETLRLEYDENDQLIAVKDGNGNAVVEYVYDSEGRRVEVKDDGGDRDYVVGTTAGGLDSPFLIVKDSRVEAAFAYAGDSPLVRVDESGNEVYYLTDAMGSIIGLVDGDGKEVADLRYDSFGNLQTPEAMPAELGGDFRFQGQWLESNTDFYHFRARYYDPETGRFLSRDPVEVIETVPESSNPYQFVYNNPHVFSDPTGKLTLIELNSGQHIQDILNTIRNQAIEEVQDMVRDYIGELATNLVMKTLQTFLPGTSIGDELNSLGGFFGPADTGDVFEPILRNTVCKLFHGTFFSQRLWVEPFVNPNGSVAHSGLNCDAIYAGNYRAPGERRPRQPQGFSPVDFIFKDGRPAQTRRNDPYAYVVGDIKITIDAAHESLTERGTQWSAISNYASKYEATHFCSLCNI